MRLPNLLVSAALLILIILSGGLTACQKCSKQQEQQPQAIVQKKHALVEIIDKYRAEHPKLMNNESTRDKGAKELQSIVIEEIKKNPSLLSSIPFQYKDAMKKGSKYIVKFEFSKYNNTPKLTNEYDLVITCFSYATSSQMENLVDDKLYKIQGTCKGSVNGKIVLPSGNTFYMNPDIHDFGSDSFGHELTIDLGGLYIADANFIAK